MPGAILCHGHDGYVDRTEIATWESGGELCVECAEPDWQRCGGCFAMTTNYDRDHDDDCRHHGGRGGADKDMWDKNHLEPSEGGSV